MSRVFPKLFGGIVIAVHPGDWRSLWQACLALSHQARAPKGAPSARHAWPFPTGSRARALKGVPFPPAPTAALRGAILVYHRSDSPGADHGNKLIFDLPYLVFTRSAKVSFHITGTTLWPCERFITGHLCGIGIGDVGRHIESTYVASSYK